MAIPRSCERRRRERSVIGTLDDPAKPNNTDDTVDEGNLATATAGRTVLKRRRRTGSSQPGSRSTAAEGLPCPDMESS